MRAPGSSAGQSTIAALGHDVAAVADQPDPVLPLADHDPAALAAARRHRSHVAAAGVVGVQPWRVTSVRWPLREPVPAWKRITAERVRVVEDAVRRAGVAVEAR